MDKDNLLKPLIFVTYVKIFAIRLRKQVIILMLLLQWIFVRLLKLLFISVVIQNYIMRATAKKVNIYRSNILNDQESSLWFNSVYCTPYNNESLTKRKEFDQKKFEKPVENTLASILFRVSIFGFLSSAILNYITV